MLVDEFFALAKPFAAMWSDLLALFERAAATTKKDQLDISYRFSGKTPELTFSLQHFRRDVEVVRDLMTPFDLRRTDSNQLWDMVRAFCQNHLASLDRSFWWPQVIAASEALHEGMLPDKLPERPRSEMPRLDVLLAETWQLVTTVLHDACTVFGRRAATHVSRAQLVAVPSGLPVRALDAAISGYWFSDVLSAMTYALSTDDLNPELADVLDEALEPLRNTNPHRRSPQRRLEELLSLPMWKHRYRR